VSSSSWILIVDDDEDIRDTLSLVLDMKGYSVAGAGDGLDALQLIRTRGRPGMILLDLRMPRMNGEELAAALHADPKLASAPIVVFSGDTTAPEVATEIGARAMLKKPIDLTQLVDVVERVMNDA
jgi:chemosensory pili system protein ChpA (sensor histidine kinase/response regulator)